MLRVVNQERSLHIHPLNNEISKRLQLDRMVKPEVDGIGAELDCPFNDASTGFLVMEDVVEWVLSNHCYVIGVKVVAKLPRHDQDGVQ